MWKCRLPARRAGKILRLLVLTLISVCVFSVWFRFLSRTLLGRCMFLQLVLARDGGVWFSEGLGFFFCCPQRFSNLLSDEKTPLYVPLLSACWKTVGTL